MFVILILTRFYLTLSLLLQNHVLPKYFDFWNRPKHKFEVPRKTNIPTTTKINTQVSNSASDIASYTNAQHRRDRI